MDYVPKRVENLYKEGHQLSLGQGTHFVMVLSNAVLLQTTDFFSQTLLIYSTMIF